MQQHPVLWGHPPARAVRGGWELTTAILVLHRVHSHSQSVAHALDDATVHAVAAPRLAGCGRVTLGGKAARLTKISNTSLYWATWSGGSECAGGLLSWKPGAWMGQTTPSALPYSVRWLWVRG